MGGRDRGSGPEGGADPSRARGRPVPSGPSPSLLTRVWHWFTVEVPDEPAPVGNPAQVQPPSTGLRRASRDGEEHDSDLDVPRAVRPAGVGAAPASAVRGQRGALAPSRRRAAATAAALLILGAVVVLAVRAGPHAPRPTAVAPHPATAARAHPTSPPARSGTFAAATPSAPDCASMHLQPVVPPAAAGHPVVQGLCYTLGGGTAWIVGCAPGFQAACDPSLQAVIDCLRQDGARQHGAIVERNVLACDVPVGTGTGGT